MVSSKVVCLYLIIVTALALPQVKLRLIVFIVPLLAINTVFVLVEFAVSWFSSAKTA